MATQTASRPRPPHTRPLVESNDLLDDSEALDRRWREQGYWFFRDVLDKNAVGTLRRIYLDELIRLGVVDKGETTPRWNGADLTNFPVKMEPLHERRVWQSFVADPAINRFFVDLLGGEAFWVPIVEYRLHAPLAAELPDPWMGRHQDGFSNEGIAFRTVWIPVMAVDAQAGGLALAPGERHRGWLHDAENAPHFPIPRSAIPDDAWHFSEYRPGDVVLFSPDIPHAGMPNYSDHFRLSLDIRVMRADAQVPVLGTVTAFTDDSITIQDEDGSETTLTIGADSYLRAHGGKRLGAAALREVLPVGGLALASHRNGHVVLLRPQR